MRVFDRDGPGRGVFNDRTPATAGAFDAAHLTSAGLTLVDPYTPGTTPAGKAGWRVEYGLPGGSVPLNVRKLPRAGGSPSAQVLDTNNEVLRRMQWLEVPRTLHACRHAPDQATARAFCSAR